MASTIMAASVDGADGAGRSEPVGVASWNGRCRSPDRREIRELFEAFIEDEDLDSLREMIRTDPWLLNEDLGHYAMHHAAERNRHSVIELLLDLGVDIDVTDAGGATTLLLCAASDSFDEEHFETMCFLQDRGANPEIVACGCSPLMLLARYRTRDFARRWLARGVKMDLVSAVRLGSEDDVRRILREDEDALGAAPDSSTLIRDALRSGSEAILRMILDAWRERNRRQGVAHRADPFYEDLANQERWAKRHGHPREPALLPVLHEYGIFADGPIEHGRTMLDLAHLQDEQRRAKSIEAFRQRAEDD